MKILIFFTILIQILQSKARIRVCKQDMIMTYNLTPYRVPKTLKFNLCPNMGSTCCSIYDQYDVYNRWQNNIKPQLERTYDEIGKKLILLERMIKFIMKMKWRKLLRKLKITKRRRLHLYKILLITLSQNMPKRISSVVYLQRKVAAYFIKLRSQFYCQICSGDNQFYFKPKKKQIIISSGSCLSIAENTIDYSFLLYRRVFFNLSKFSQILMEFSQDSIPQPLKLPGLRGKIKKVFNCFQRKSADGTIKRGCKRYCEYYTQNSISPEIEGDLVFLDKSLHYIAKFIRENYTLVPSTDRILESKDFIYDKNQEKIIKYAKNPVDFYNKPTGMTNEDIKEIFKSNTMDETQESLEIFAKSYLSYYDPKIDFGKPDVWKVFSFKKFNQVDLENYSTKVGLRGMDLFNKKQQLADMRINQPIMDIVEGIKNKKSDEIPNEVLDDKLVIQLNQVDDKYLKKFHGDLFMDFNPQYALDAVNQNTLQKIAKNKEIIEEKENVKLPPITKEEKKKEEENPVAKTTEKVTETIGKTAETLKDFPSDTRAYLKKTIDDLQYGKRPTI